MKELKCFEVTLKKKEGAVTTLLSGGVTTFSSDLSSIETS